MSSGKPVAVVTGGAGFIGSHMVDALVGAGFAVRVIDNLVGGHRSNLDHLKGNPDLACYWQDIRQLEPNSPIFADAKCVFHFAGIGDIVPSIEQPTQYMDTNVQGTVRVLECARQARVEKFVYAASSSCYGLAAVPTSEDHPIDPQYPYALSKYQGEQAAFHWHRVYGLPVNSVCIFNAYGPRVRTTGVYGAVFGVFFRQKLAGKPYTVVGDGTQRRDFIYVTDVAQAFLAAARTSISGERFLQLLHELWPRQSFRFRPHRSLRLDLLQQWTRPGRFVEFLEPGPIDIGHDGLSQACVEQASEGFEGTLGRKRFYAHSPKPSLRFIRCHAAPTPGTPVHSNGR